MALPAISQTASTAAPPNWTHVQALLHQASLSMNHVDDDCSASFERMLSHALLDLALLQAQAFLCGNQSGSPAQQQQATVAHASPSTKQFAGLLPDLATLLQHLVAVTDHHIITTLEQLLVQLNQQHQFEEVKAVMQMGLQGNEVSNG